jgi:hypothetical protein
VNDGLVLSFVCAHDSQKAAMIARGDRLSVAIGRAATESGGDHRPVDGGAREGDERGRRRSPRF